MTIDSVIGSKFGDCTVLSFIEKKSNWYTSTYKIRCNVCGAILSRKGQALYKKPKHNRYCYQGLYNDVPWKEQYSRRYANILRRCKTSKYYSNINCKLEFYEFMEEMLYLQKVNNLSNYDMTTLTIDRVDNNKDYEKGNLRLATKLTQIYNRKVKPNCFIAKKNNIRILSNSSKLFADYIGCLVGSVNNAIKRDSKTSGWKIDKIDEEQFIKFKNDDKWDKVIYKNYIEGLPHSEWITGKE